MLLIQVDTIASLLGFETLHLAPIWSSKRQETVSPDSLNIFERGSQESAQQRAAGWPSLAWTDRGFKAKMHVFT